VPGAGSPQHPWRKHDETCTDCGMQRPPTIARNVLHLVLNWNNLVVGTSQIFVIDLNVYFHVLYIIFVPVLDHPRVYTVFFSG
jgi:hypothetical protein